MQHVGKELAFKFRQQMIFVRVLTSVVHRKRPFRTSLLLILAAFVGIAAGKTVIGSLGSVSVVDGVSMEPTYQSGACVYTAPISTPLERGDIVLVNDGDSGYALKRIIGLPGETIHLWRGYVFVNRRMLKESYLPKYTYTFPDERTEMSTFKTGRDEYFLLGDNRTRSADSRFYGPVKLNQIVSRVPLPESTIRPKQTAFTLPAQGKRTIRPSGA